MEKEYQISWLKVMIGIIILIVIVGILCLMIPKKESKANPDVLSVYINNIGLMKEAGFEYFQGSNLPSKIGESNSLTLEDLIDGKLIMPFVDENGKSCDVNSSYIKVTKTLDSEYAMKVNLSCDSKTDYIVTSIIGNKIIADSGFTNSTGSSNNSSGLSTNNTSGNTTNSSTITKPSNSGSSSNTTNKGNTSSGNVTQVTNVNINYVNTCNTANCLNTCTTSNCLNNVYNTVNFDTQGGSYVSRQIVKSGDTANYVISYRDGYSFVGWYLNGSKYDFNTPVTQPITLVAKWEKIKNNNQTPAVKSYIVNFQSNGGTPVSFQVINEGNRVVVPSNPTRNCYTFVGWYVNSSLTEKYDFTNGVTKDMTLYAKWVDNGTCVNEYTVSFNSNGGSYVSPQTVNEGNSIIVPSNPTRSCYDFAGWYTN
ncbi:MAG: InlB B-repeat-containing protein, partial [Bacilli bacterium]|nr:InlB B-repeat-containing protein [Bacilli bacterium]